VPVGIGIGEQHDALVAQLAELETRPDPATERGHQIGELFVLDHFADAQTLGVQHFAAQR
jgi:hypothetical protein